MDDTTSSTPADPEQDQSGVQSAAVTQTSGTATDAQPLAAVVEVFPGVAAVFGAVPDGLERIDSESSSLDSGQLARLLGVAGNTGTIAGNLATAMASSQGLYRLNSATTALLKSGGQLAVKDGASIGAVFLNGKIVAQAGFISAGVTVAEMAAAIGPAVAMVALQVMIGQVSSAIEKNIAATSQVLKEFRKDQQAELKSLARIVDEVFKKSVRRGAVSNAMWYQIAGLQQSLYKQLELYPDKVASHIKGLTSSDATKRRNYLELNAESISFDVSALFIALKAEAEYKTLSMVYARQQEDRIADEILCADEVEARDRFDAEYTLAVQLITSLERELRLIAQLPGRKTMPLSKKRNDETVSRLTCAALLEAISPVANIFCAVRSELKLPDAHCMPAEFDVEPYLQVLRWLLNDGEVLHGLAFPYSPAENYFGSTSGLLENRVDASWNFLGKGIRSRIGSNVSYGSFVAITNRRIITADPRTFLAQGQVGECFELNVIRNVRPPAMHENPIRPTITVTTEKRDLIWMFPEAADNEVIDRLVALLEESQPAVAVREEDAAKEEPQQISATSADDATEQHAVQAEG